MGKELLNNRAIDGILFLYSHVFLLFVALDIHSQKRLLLLSLNP